MRRPSPIRWLVWVAASIAASGATSVLAQTPLPAPKPYEATDANGVDLTSGGLTVRGPGISIGDPQQGGLANSVTFIGTGASIGWRHSAFSGISRSPTTGSGAWYTVTVMGQSNIFVESGAGFLLLEGDGGTLTLSGGVYTFTDKVGTVTTFQDGLTTLWPYNANEAVATTIQRPDGVRIDYHYRSIASGGDTIIRPQSVTTNLGYQLHFSYQSDAFGPAFRYVSTVTALNNAVDACDPLAIACSYSQTWPRLMLTANSATDALGRVTRVSTDSNLHVVGIARPSLASGFNDTVTWDNAANQVATYSNGAGTWTYDFENSGPAEPPLLLINTVTDPLAHQTAVEVSVIEPWTVGGQRRSRIVSVTDPLGQETAFSYDDAGRLDSAMAPQGDVQQWAYTNEGGLSSWRHTSKPGSGLSAISITATYADCSTPVRCRRPTSVIDVRGNTTDYTYDAAGNLLTETGPAPTAGAARPQSRYVWEARYAWYKYNGAAAITQAATPVLVLVETSQCVSGATC